MSVQLHGSWCFVLRIASKLKSMNVAPRVVLLPIAGLSLVRVTKKMATGRVCVCVCVCVYFMNICNII